MNNVVNEYTDFVLKQFCFYAKQIMQKYYSASIFNELANEYISIRYHNIYPQKQNNKTTINYYLNLKVKELCDSNPKKVKNITFMVDIFKYLIYLNTDLEADMVNDIEKEIEKLRKEKYDIDETLEFSKEYRNFRKAKRQFISCYETDDFYVEVCKTKNKNLFDTELKHNVKMLELYSKNAIDGVFNSKQLSEDKLFVLYNLMAINVLKDIIEYDYTSTYLIDFNVELFNKPDKFNRLLKIIDNDITRDKLCFKLEYKSLLDNKEKIFNLIKNGYNFAIIKDDSYVSNEYDGLFKCILDKEV